MHVESGPVPKHTSNSGPASDPRALAAIYERHVDALMEDIVCMLEHVQRGGLRVPQELARKVDALLNPRANGLTARGSAPPPGAPGARTEGGPDSA